MAASPLKIGDAAKAAGVHIDTLRYYERRELLPKAARSGGNYRLYSPEMLRRVRFIKRAKELGFSLKEIKDFLALSEDPELCPSAVRARATVKLANIDAKIRELRAIRAELVKLLATCTGQDDPGECSILRRLNGGPYRLSHAESIGDSRMRPREAKRVGAK